MIKNDIGTKLYEMSPADNVIYFPNNVDVRLCPKNGMSTLKELQRLYRGVDNHVGRVDRLTKVRTHGDQFDIPFRKGSFRIAVRRDPVDRFLSACEYIVANQAKHIAQGRIDELPTLSHEMEEVITSIENGIIKNNHFYTQSWYMGKPEDYDMIVHINELDRLLRFINISSDLGFTKDETSIHDNKTVLKMYNSYVSDSQRDRIKELYKKDYLNGWCKIDDKI